VTILFPLALRGFGTHDIESLGSYIHRLSISHNVSVNHLLEYSFAWYLEKHDDNVKEHVFRSCGDLSHFSRPNNLTLELVKVLEYLTGEEKLRSSTFLAVYKALDRSTRQYARHFRWCPQCMYEFKLADDPGYFKLIWTILDVTHCPEHRVKLIDKCHHCGSYQGGFGYKKSCRICKKCGENLGQLLMIDDLNDMISTWDLKGIDLVNFVDRIARESELSYPENGIKNLLSKIFDKVWASDEENLLWAIIPRDEYLSLTCGNTTVSLQIARRFSARLGVELSDLLTGDFTRIPYLLDLNWFKELPKEFKPKKRTVKHSRIEVYNKLTRICRFASSHHDPISTIADNLGVSKGYLEYHFPEIIGKIKNHNLEWDKKIKLIKQHKARVEALKYFTEKDFYINISRKDALKKIRNKTGLPKNMLFNEINLVYKMLF